MILPKEKLLWKEAMGFSLLEYCSTCSGSKATLFLKALKYLSLLASLVAFSGVFPNFRLLPPSLSVTVPHFADFTSLR